ncbi:Hcp family type VI secretion system effector [Aurantiacibacter zhengii]|uniref:Hcp1 family type VI secretion system effector n=1 Tax=Aurantiacibacter zhengii TaxID=2307003 RepID=A0A418NN52_9SPHN|nr:type VI secretion system tube protein Hcp [Aurantiacibacter zhengii]RIV82860.1 Hcp1 family type VI secretion system effector [Aurantiacibacter zhengii]
MTVSVFMKPDGIEGEATDEKHDKEIRLSSCSFAASNSSAYNNASKTVSKGQAQMADIQFSKEADKTSVELFKACASGKVIPKVKISFQTNVGDDKKIDFLVYELENVVVNSYNFSASSEADEHGSLTYAKIKQIYDQRDEKGNSKGKVEGFFDVLLNKAG